jgi:hypothetical protein
MSDELTRIERAEHGTSRGETICSMATRQPQENAIEYRAESEDIFTIVIIGELTVPSAHEVLAEVMRFAEGKPRVYLIVDLTYTAAIPSEGRKVLSDGVKNTTLAAIACFGATFTIRALATLVFKAVRVLRKRTYPVRFFSTFDEARAWLGELGARTSRIPKR